MDFKTNLDALYAEADALIAKGDLSDADVARGNALAKEIPLLEEKLKKQEDMSAALARFKRSTTTATPGGFGASTHKTKGLEPSRGRVNPAFIQSFTKSLSSIDPATGDVRKALVPAGLTGFQYSGEIIAPPQAPLSIVDLVNQVSVGQPNGTVLQETGHVFNIQSVPLGQVKPTSTITLGPVQWKIASIATLVGPVYRQWFEDFENLASYIATRIGYGLQVALNGFLLNGATALEDNTQVNGILNSGAAVQAYTSDVLTTIATSISTLNANGVTPTAIAMNATDWLTIALLRSSATGNFLIGGPAEQTKQQLFGLPVVLDPQIPVGKAIVADWSTIHCLNRESFHQEVFTQGQAGAPVAGSSYGNRTEATDLVATNQVMIRAEGRYGLFLEQLPAIQIVNLHA